MFDIRPRHGGLHPVIFKTEALTAPGLFLIADMTESLLEIEV